MIIAGGYDKYSVEVLTCDLGTKHRPDLPKEIDGSSLGSAQWSHLIVWR